MNGLLSKHANEQWFRLQTLLSSPCVSCTCPFKRACTIPYLFSLTPEPDASFRGEPIPFLCFNRKKLACRTGAPRACSKHLNANPLKREAMRGVEVMFKCAFTWMLCYEVHQLLKSLVPGCIGKNFKKSFLRRYWRFGLEIYDAIT